MDIRYLTNREIDFSKWDNCIDQADNGLIYAYSIYLSKMSANWDALILGDYQAVMPLTWNKKYGISYLYQPFFCACLGVFGKEVSSKLVQDFIQQIPSHFRLWDIYLNHNNYPGDAAEGWYERSNFVLSLTADYETLYAGFRDNIKRNIKKSVQLQCAVIRDIDIKQVIELSKTQATAFSPIDSKHYDQFRQLYNELKKRGKATTYGIKSTHNELVASCAFFYSNKRAYYILVGNHPNGKTIGASHALINAFIQDHAGEDLLLDFEGSDVPSLAFFYSSFGATEEKYYGLKVNRLPFWAKMFKK